LVTQCSTERSYAVLSRPAVSMSVLLVYPDHIVLFLNNYTIISLGSSLPGDNEALVCYKGWSVPKWSSGNSRWNRREMDIMRHYIVSSATAWLSC